MIEQLRKNAGHWIVALGIILAGLVGGCQSGPTLPETGVGNTLHVGDGVSVFGTLPTGNITDFPPSADHVHEDGTITLPLIGSVPAAGKTIAELQKEIHDLYVPKYYPGLTLTVKGDATFFYVDGEVQQRGQKEYTGQMTIVKAIADAGGFTDFAKQSRVRLTRGNRTEIINVKKAIVDPKYDVPVLPGDKIHVPRRIF